MPLKNESENMIDFDELVREIGDGGVARDSKLEALAKGMRDGFGNIFALLKAKDEEIEDEDEDEDGEEEEEDAGAGADDIMGMEKGRTDDGEEFVDATDLLVAMSADLVALRKAVGNGGTSILEGRMDRLEALLESVVRDGLAPMAKGVVDANILLDKIVDGTGGDVVNFAAAAASRKRQGKKLGLTGSEAKRPAGITEQHLIKAQAKGIVDANDLRWLNRNLAIPDELNGESKHAAILAIQL